LNHWDLVFGNAHIGRRTTLAEYHGFQGHWARKDLRTAGFDFESGSAPEGFDRAPQFGRHSEHDLG